MQRGRLFCAAAMTAAAITALAGYTAAGQSQAPQPAPQPAAAAAPAETPPAPLWVAVVDETGAAGALTVTDEAGETVARLPPERPGQYRLTLTPGSRYRLAGTDVAASFYLADNGAVSDVTGDGWCDGEVVYLTAEARCTVHVFQEGAAGAACRLAGDGDTALAWFRDGGGGRARAVFSGLAPGTYTLTGPDGAVRTVTLTADQPDLAVHLE